ncbi:hypothetical protein LSH36_643g00002, partial [Paralvinella palmiformis]
MSKTLIRAISLFRNLYCTQAIARYGTHRQDDQAILTGSHSRRNRQNGLMSYRMFTLFIHRGQYLG